MNLWQFMSDSPWLALAIVVTVGVLVETVVKMTMRGINIAKHGWPPPHVNADGDFKEEQK